MLAHVQESGAPLDFISTHTYGNAPLDLRPITARFGRADLPIYWTEWGAHATHFNRAHDSVWSAAYLVRGMVSAMGRLDALSYWTLSDHFEELGRPPALLHGGFGLLAVGNLRKPRWWGLWMLEQLGETRVAVRSDGDGAGDMVHAVAARSSGLPAHAAVSVVIWNGTVDVTKSAGSDLLTRTVTVEVDGLEEGSYGVRHRRLDHQHSDLNAAWASIGQGADWPDDDQWRQLVGLDRLEDLEPERYAHTSDGRLTLRFELPMPAVALIDITRT